MRNKVLIFLLAVVIIILTAACSKPADDTASQMTPTPELKKTVEAFGIVEINDIKNINLDFDAVVEAVEVKEGQRVKKGDTLLVLNVDNYLNDIKTKEHELNAIRLEAKKLEGKLTEEELENNKDPDIEKLVNDLSYANEVLHKALEEQKTQEQLLTSGAISQKQYDDFMETIDEKKKTVEDIKYNLDITLYEKKLNNKEIIDSMAVQRENAAAKESEILQMKSKLNRDYISDNSIVSDMDNGIVYEIGYKPGDWVDPSVKVLSIMNLDTMTVKADVAEEFIKDVKIGANVEIVPIADKSRQYKGKVIDISSKALEKNGETVIPVEISIDNRDDFLLPQFNVDVEIYME